MIKGPIIIAAALGYLLLLFVVASYGDSQHRRARRLTNRPAIYALSLAVYCTTWTFFGSVGIAANQGLTFLAVYVGPILMITVGFPVFHRIVALSKSESITSVADFIGARYGKSVLVAAVATVIAAVGTVPYIALQLKAISVSLAAIASHYDAEQIANLPLVGDVSIPIALTLALFTILFGTRHADATEHQDGLVLAVAMESIVKLVAFLCVGLFVTFVMFDGVGDMARQAAASEQVREFLARPINGGSWLVIMLLSFMASVLLPRQFHMAVVENHTEQELVRARWLFPLYLVLINLFVVPIAIAGMLKFGSGVDADMYVLALPMSAGADAVSLLVFLGGLSAGTAMVAVACVALAIMISNNLVLPVLLRTNILGMSRNFGNMEQKILRIRRMAIILVLTFAYLYYRSADNTAALASIGLVSFAAIAQLAPSLFGGLVWRGATARGAIAGMLAGSVVWMFTLLLPTILPLEHPLMVNGLFGLGILRPHAILNLHFEPLGHGVFWSLAMNTLFFVGFSLSRNPNSMERVQSTVFVSEELPMMPMQRRAKSPLTVAEINETVSRFLGKERTERAFDAYWLQKGGRPAAEEWADDELLKFSEQLLASAIGASSSRLVHMLMLRRHDSSRASEVKLLDDASQALQYNRDVLQTALDQVEQGICVFDKEFRLTWWNQRFRKLLNLPASVGHVGVPLGRLADAVGESNPALDEGDFADDLVHRIATLHDPWLVTLADRNRIVEVTPSAMPDGGVVVTWDDITERVNSAEALREANEGLELRVDERTRELTQLNRQLKLATAEAHRANIGKTRFLAAAGHDILQPLNAARLYSSTLVERADDARHQKLASNIDRSLESVEDILDAVLELSKLDTGAFDTNPAPFAINKVLRQLEVEFAPVAEANTIGMKILPSNLWVNSDPSLLRRLLQNLISNAIKYTINGRVLVGCRRRGDQVVVQVYDTGPGIPERMHQTIFNEFKRLDDAARRTAGLGLGLSIVERIAKVLDHEVSLRSQMGKGTVFSVRLPAAKPIAVPDISETPVTAPMLAELSGRPVLCIDNDVRILDGMRQLIGGWGCTVITAQDLAEAERVIADEKLVPDVILADYHLLEGDGIDAILKLRRRIEPGLPAVLITADRSPALLDQARQHGIEILHKPVKRAALRALLTRLRPIVEAAE